MFGDQTGPTTMLAEVSDRPRNGRQVSGLLRHTWVRDPATNRRASEKLASIQPGCHK
jgi:hypothetical protein